MGGNLSMCYAQFNFCNNIIEHISMNVFSFRIAFVIHTCDTHALLHMFFEIHIPMSNIILSIQNCFMSSKSLGSRILLWVGVKHNPNNKKKDMWEILCVSNVFRLILDVIFFHQVFWIKLLFLFVKFHGWFQNW